MTLRLRSVLLAGSLLASGPALAQVSPPDAGQALRESRQLSPPAAAPKPSPSLSVPAETDVAADPGQSLTISAIEIQGATRIPVSELQPLVADLVGKPVSLGQLRAGVRRITAYYRDRGYIVARAFIPAQEIEGGVLKVQVLEGRLSEARGANASAVNDAVVQRVLEAQDLTGEVITASAVDRALLLLADLPSVGKVAGKLRPGEAVGTSDLVATLDKGERFEGQAGLDTYGNRYTGQNRLSFRGDWNSPLGLGDRLGGQFNLTDEKLAYGRLAYDLPVGGDGLRLGGALSMSSYELGQEFASLNATGTARTAGLYASYPMIRSLHRNVWLTANFERRELEDEIAAVASKTEKSANVASLEAYGDQVDALLGGGYTSWRAALSTGRLSIETPAALALDRSGPRTAGDYGKLALSVTRLQAITARTSLSVAASGQLADKNLDSSEKFVIGGVYGVRAYPQGEGSGDRGWLVNIELRRQVTSGLQLAAFYDAGRVDFNEDVYLPGKQGVDLAGYGVSAAAGRGPISAKVSLAWRAGGSDAPSSAPDRSPRIWGSLGYRF